MTRDDTQNRKDTTSTWKKKKCKKPKRDVIIVHSFPDSCIIKVAWHVFRYDIECYLVNCHGSCRPCHERSVPELNSLSITLPFPGQIRPWRNFPVHSSIHSNRLQVSSKILNSLLSLSQTSFCFFVSFSFSLLTHYCL